jgi:hypothetical protein
MATYIDLRRFCVGNSYHCPIFFPKSEKPKNIDPALPVKAAAKDIGEAHVWNV